MNAQPDDRPTPANVDAALAAAAQVLRERFGHDRFLPGQAEALRSVLAGRSLVVVMPTGSGKSLLYQLPALLGDGLTVVVSPLIALMKDQVDELRRRRIPATFVNSSLGLEEQRSRLGRCLRGEYRLLYVAPERMRNAAFCEMLRRVRVSRMAVDEAHCISQWGHDFRPDYRRLKEFRAQMGMPSVTALTATATPRVQRDIIESLGLASDEADLHVHGFDRPNLIPRVVNAIDEEAKDEFLRRFLRHERGCGIIYVGTRKVAEGLARRLKEIEPTARAYHAGQESDVRSAAQEAFLAGKARVIVATIAFGMGIDKRDVRFVIHYQYPASVEGYYQEIGRAGRDGLPAHCVLLYSPGDRMLREFFIDINYPAREQVEEVYETLWDIEENPVLMTYKEIAEVCGSGMKDGHVGSAVRLLDGAGMTRALAGDAAALVRTTRPAAQILAEIRGPLQRRVLEALSAAVDLETPGDYGVEIGQVAAASGLSGEQVRRALVTLDKEGRIHYEPPFRGRGVEKLVEPPPPFGKVPIDWKRQDLLRRSEEEKLAAMESYIYTSKCRRRFIVEYFGETSDLRCGVCDRCEAAKPGERTPGGVLDDQPQVAMAVLACMRDLHFPLGATRVAQVVTGSRAKEILEWGLTGNAAYGVVTAKPDAVRKAIGRLVTEGYLMREAGDRPVLALTTLGEEEAERVDLSALAAKPLQEAPPKRPAVEESDDAAIRLAALRCVAELGTHIGATKVAEALTGSQAEWVSRLGADQLPVYASIRAKRQRVIEIVRGMVDEGLLDVDRHTGYPLLQVTEEGRRELAAGPREAEEPEPLGEQAEAEPMPPVDATLRGAVEQVVWELLACDRARAKVLVEELRVVHPRELAQRLERLYVEFNDLRLRSRAVWAVGELCGEHGLGFLVRCTKSEEPTVRRLAASALGKALANARAAAERLPAEVSLAEAALAGPRGDERKQRVK